MTDPLRDRIIEILTAAELATQRFLDTDGQHSTRIRSNEAAAAIAADAVIAELKRHDCGGDLCECSQCRVIRRMGADDE